MTDTTKLKLEHVAIVFANLEDEGFGRSLTIDVTDKAVQDKITAWVKENNIGKTTPGVVKFKEYEGKLQYALKISDYTQFAGLNGLTKDNLGFSAKVSIVAQAFEYDNKFGKGVSANLSAVLVEERAKTSADADMAELMGGQIVPNEEVPEFSEADVPLTADDFPM
jgi:hypothetical protein